MRMRARVWVVATTLLAGVLSGCDTSDQGRADPGPQAPTSVSAPTVAPDAAEPASTGPAPSDLAPTTEPPPGQPCEPGSHPDCSDATGTDGDPFRIIAGYADCVASFPDDESYGLCTDLDGDDHAGYADAG